MTRTLCWKKETEAWGLGTPSLRRCGTVARRCLPSTTFTPENHTIELFVKKKNYNHVWRKLTVECWAAGVPPLWDTWSSARVTPACWEQRESTFYVILKANTSVREWITPREGIKICWKELERIFYVHGNVPYPDTDLVLQFRPKPKSLVQTRFLNI